LSDDPLLVDPLLADPLLVDPLLVDPLVPGGRVPRHVWALLILVVLVLGFAVGGSARTALEPTGAASPRFALPAAAAPLATLGTAQVAQVASAAPSARPDRVAPSASRRGKPVPAGSGTGRRIIYQQSTMHLWVLDADGTAVRDYPVTGRPGWPLVGTYHVFSKAVSTASPKYGVTFDWMVRFAHGHELSIGFHSIPRWIGSGLPIQSESSLGAPIGHGGCVRQRAVDAKWLYGWASIGTTVVVLH
jgi:lipoprotein-anchoring transpeptidase ErfK/SrfK